MTSTIGGITQINALNTNQLFIRGVEADFQGSTAFLQGEIDAIELQLVGINSVVSRIDFNQPTPLVGSLVITEENKNSVLLTAIQNINTQIAKLNQFDLTGLPVPQTCVITTATTNQALKTLIDANASNITTIQGQITTINGQITTINGQITAINTKLAHYSTWVAGASSIMSGIRDGTGFACDLGANDTGNGIFVYPNGDAHTAQIRIETENSKQLYMRGGGAAILYGGSNGDIQNRNLVRIGDDTDNIKIGTINSIGRYAYIQIGAGYVSGGNMSTTEISGDISFPSLAPVPPNVYTNVLKVGTTGGLSTENDPTFVGLDVVSLAGSVAPITFTCPTGLIAMTALAGGFLFNTAAGAFAATTGLGAITLTTGAGAITLTTGAGAMEFTSGAGGINMKSVIGDITIGAGKSAGTIQSGDTIINAHGIIQLAPDNYTQIEKTIWLELNNLTSLPATTTNRLYLLNNVLQFNGAPLGGGGGTVQSVAATANANITMAGTATNPTVGVASPLNATLNIGSQNITGVNAASLSIIDGNAPNSQALVNATSVNVYDAVGTIANYATMTKNSVFVQSATDQTTLNATGIVKTGTSPLAITNTAAGEDIVLSAGAGAGIISTNSQFKPLAILDTANSAGTANYVLSAGTGGGTLAWVPQGGGGGGLPLTGGTLTGALNITYDGGNAGSLPPQLNIINTNNTGTVAGQGATLSLRNDATGVGSIGERCGLIDFKADDSAGTGGRTYASIQGFINDPTSTAIDGRLSQYVVSNNTQTEMLRLISTSTGVRQVNVAANYTTIGANSLGSAATSNLTVLGTTNSTISLQTPLIYNCPQIFPQTSTTQVDNAVPQYQPERLYKLTDYPTPLNAPTTNGEKVIFLNPTGAPVNVVDSILQASDFPTLDTTFTFQNIVFTKYVDATAFTPAFNLIVANYSGNIPYLFIQPDIAGIISLTYLAKAYSSVGAAPVQINDLICTTYSGASRIYFGGKFDTITLGLQGSGQIEPALNFSGQIVLQWGGVAPNFTIVSKIINPMYSTNAPQDANAFSAINGVSAGISTVINVKGSGFAQPDYTYDSIVIAGDFVSIGTGTPATRPLQRVAWYNYANSNPINITLVNNSGPGVFNQIIGQLDLTAQFNITVAASYNISVSNLIYSTTNPSTYSASFGIYYNNGQGTTSLIANSSVPFILDSSQSTRSFNTGFLPLTPNTAPNSYYFVGMSCPGTTPIPSDVYVGLENAQTNTRCCVATAVQSGPPVGWSTPSDTNWFAPVGADAFVRGGALASSGYLIFTYDGTTCNNSSLTSYYAFSLYYSSGTGNLNIVGDAELIQLGQSWVSDYNGGHNNVSGGNPTLPYGAGNAVAYDEVYFNNGTFNAGGSGGVSYRPSSVDPYEATNSLVINGVNVALGANQLKPQFGSVKFVGVYRDDTKYPNIYFCATGTELQTAELPFTSGVPNYGSVQVGGASIPCTGFGGYSDEIGYTGALFITNNNLYVYKLSSSGELVIELGTCVVRCANNIYAQNKLTFPANQDGTSLTLVGDTSTANPYNKPSWWAIAQDGGIYYDNTLVNNNGGVQSVSATGAGITATTTAGAVQIANTGVVSLTAGSGISVSAATGAITISATPAAVPTGVLIVHLGQKVINNLNTQQNGNAEYIPFNNIVAATGLGTQFAISSGGDPTYLTYNGTNPITINVSADCSWQSSSSSGISEFTNSNGSVNAYAYSACNFSLEITDNQGTFPTNFQVAGLPLGVGSVNNKGGYGGTLTATSYMRAQSYIRFAGITNYSFNDTYASPNTYQCTTNYGTDDLLVLTCYESVFPF
jgi:hypothetical protein